MKKPLPIGIDNFEEIITKNYYYVDKSLLIKELLESRAKATLIPRPRRFGKTLNMSMLRFFFEKSKNASSHLFDSLAISNHEEIMAHKGQYPVIFFTLKFIDSLVWDECFDKLKRIISEEYRRHRYLLDSSCLDATQVKEFEAILSLEASKVAYEVSLKNLIRYLSEYHNKNPIVFIDEYDVPIHAGFRHDYFIQVVSFMKSFLGDGIKDNSNLEFAVITGALRVARESIFTGWNNLKVCTFLSEFYGDKFGLLEREVQDMLSYYGLNANLDEVRSWYNGYTSGAATVYNPWSIINFADNKGILQPYWINTSTNDIIKSLITEGGGGVEEDIEALIARKSITKEISENIVYSDIKKNTNSLWNFLFFSGYLTFKNSRIINRKPTVDFLIPNEEVRYFFESTILSWIQQQAGEIEYNYMLKSLVAGDIATFNKLFSNFVLRALSYFDLSGKKPERFYHAFVLGMLVSLSSSYDIRSNRESGYGRYDVMIIPHDVNKPGIVIEFKKVDTYENETLEQAAKAAIKQIEEKRYAEEIKAQGIGAVIIVSIAFSGKNVLILSKEIV